jgi:hypothetical protein
VDVVAVPIVKYIIPGPSLKIVAPLRDVFDAKAVANVVLVALVAPVPPEVEVERFAVTVPEMGKGCPEELPITVIVGCAALNPFAIHSPN